MFMFKVKVEWKTKNFDEKLIFIYFFDEWNYIEY